MLQLEKKAVFMLTLLILWHGTHVSLSVIPHMKNSSLPVSVLSHPFWDILVLYVCVFSPCV